MYATTLRRGALCTVSINPLIRCRFKLFSLLYSIFSGLTKTKLSAESAVPAFEFSKR